MTDQTPDGGRLPEAMPEMPDVEVREMWRSVQGPHAELTGPLIRFAGLLRAAGAAQERARIEDIFWRYGHADLTGQRVRSILGEIIDEIRAARTPPTPEAQ